MQTILGANGQIGSGLAACLKRNFTSDIRLVSRRPRQVNATDQLLSADLLDPTQAIKAIEGSEIVYMTVGLPLETRLWTEQWPILMQNTINACATEGAKLVFFDNTYMYPQTAQPQTEETPFLPNGAKGKVRAAIVTELQQAMAEGRVQAMICRAPEFYGPGKTQSITNSTIIEPLKSDKTARVFLRDDTLRSLIYTPDASRAMGVLGNTPDAYNQTWHLPCDDNRLTYRQFIELAAGIFGVEPSYKILKRWQLALAGLLNQKIRDSAELLPRYSVDNIFLSNKFKARFPSFPVTTFKQGLTVIGNEPSS
ncbi:MAG: NAD-dependent epimerase/dehydratase family protein [Caldilineaceae bacterium]|nr:NAD-dependent epimerase/dehydratase family protein [Caldilineaceae bacterium]